MRPSVALAAKRLLVREATERHRLRNPRVFGSAARRTDRPDSDLDILVDPLPTTSLFDIGGLQADLEALLGVKVDVVTPGDLPEVFRNAVLREALPI